MAYTTVDDPTIYFTAKAYTGNNSSQTITGIGFQPDWVWFKSRTTTDSHYLVDSVRGNTKYLRSQTNTAEETNTTAVTSFNADGYALGSAGNVNDNANYVSWNWKAGTSFSNDASATGIGSIDSSGSVSTTAGFSICSYTGTGGTETIKHGLSSKPAVIIVKKRSGAANWYMYHHKNTSAPATDFLTLNSTAATSDNANNWNDTEPTSSVFSVGASGTTNPSGGTMIAYCFAEKKGYSKFGSYTGNGNADGTFVYTGFRPAFILVKKSSGTKNWYLWDSTRASSNDGSDPQLYANLSNAEDSGAYFDILSNGFKNRNTGVGNDSGGTYIYMAFSESSFVNSSGVPNNAR